MAELDRTPVRKAYWGRRAVRHTLLATASCVIVGVVAALLPAGPPTFRLSMGTAYAALGLLSVTLLMGPWNVLRGRPDPVSTDLRRDIGVWAAITGLVHMVFGLQVHLAGHMEQYFLWPPEAGRLVPLRYDIAGVANFSGLGAAVVLLLLLALSNDIALRRLGAPRWKSLQRWNYGGFALVALHGIIYQVIEQRSVRWVVPFLGTVAVVVAVQGAA